MKRTSILYLLLAFIVFSSFNPDETISLAGIWNFQTDPGDKGILEKWYTKTLSDQIKLPGSMAENRKGDPVTLQTKWTGSIYDSSFFFNPRLAKYREPDNLHIPFWLTPAKHYVGAAWYQKEVKIPASWKSKRIVLMLERAHTETTVWVDDQRVGMQNSLVAAHQYDLSAYLKEGTHRITIRIDNRVKEINVGPDSHSITDHTQGNWNGIIGKIALQTTAPVYFKDIQVFPDLQQRKARVRMTLENTTGKKLDGQITLAAKSFNATKNHQTTPVKKPFSLETADSSVIEMDLPMGAEMKTWDEFNPALYQLTAQLKTKEFEQSKSVQFGMREIKIEGNRILVNGRAVFFRGTVHNCEFPLTGYPSTQVSDWERTFLILKKHGLNHVRFHSWCPPEAAFIAADKLGIYLQPEGPSWPNHGPKIGLGQGIDRYLYDETNRMAKDYGNYASFIMLAAGNEPAGDQVKYLNAFVDYWKGKDNRRIYTGMCIGTSWPLVPKAEYLVRSGLRGLTWDKRPETLSDHREALSKFSVPYVAHEVGQYCVFPNFDEIKKYTGVYRAKNFELFQQDLRDHGMIDQARDFMMASGKLQLVCYKNDIEKILRTPGYAGFQLLGLQDFPGQGTALVGKLDAFFDEKGYSNSDQFKRFCNTTVPLARFPKFVFTNVETAEIGIDITHAGPNPLQPTTLNWRVKDAAGKVLKTGTLKTDRIEIANGSPIGKISLPLDIIQKPTQLNLEVSIANTPFVNDWNFWVFPEKQPEIAGDVYYTTELDEKAKSILEKGGKVFLNAAGKVVKGKEVSMHFLPVFWNTSWFKMRPPHVTGLLIQQKSAAFQSFPTAFHSDLQWWDIANRAQVMVLEDFPVGFKPLVQPIDTWFLNRRLALVYEAKVGKGKIIVSSADLRKDSDRTASKALYHSLLQYMHSNQFNPTGTLSLAVIQDVFQSPSKEQFNPYTKDSPDELRPNSNQNKINSN
jgi:hypothetical protein